MVNGLRTTLSDHSAEELLEHAYKKIIWKYMTYSSHLLLRKTTL